ncbi:MAG: glycyl-radical enzyme activating protein [Candidatus Heimdallarchaeota archaeon]|nr:glycyl-radical enzyme activating protein [Candidatus Heimdallarchaeota archaeon]MCK5049391.1 glycyl-radical enzyme activating protein [Candidatus Heimdallarchaeota archaeon]
MQHGTIFDIKQFAVHDGPGIRTTVFLKGCTLSCQWCHNPEGISPSLDLFFNSYLCMKCNTCFNLCPNEAIIDDSKITILRELCDKCMLCANDCPTEALQKSGRSINSTELMEEILKSTIYYDFSEGGVTFSGGEPLLQSSFLKEVLEKCKKEGIHTTLDTSGYSSLKILKSVIDYIDLFLFDLKLINERLHKEFTGVPNKQIIENLRFITQTRSNDVIIRIPIIPGITSTDQNIEDILTLLSSLNMVKEVNLLPFHNVSEKYDRLGMEYKLDHVRAPSDEEMAKVKERFEEKGFKVK